MSSDTSAPEFGETVLRQIIDLWVRPELQRRGIAADDLPSQALVLFESSQPPRVLLDDECGWIAQVRATRPIAKGEPITQADFSAVEAVRLAVVDENAGWIGFVTLGASSFVAFDFRRNRGRARALIKRGREFLLAARAALAAQAHGPALDCAFAAAELAVTAQLLVFEDRPPRRHSARQARWTGWTRLGNAPTEHATALNDLARMRPAARYAEGELNVPEARVAELLDLSREMLDFAQGQVGEPPSVAESQSDLPT